MNTTQARYLRKGFTLIELLVVVFILGILTSVALPSYISSVNAAREGAANSNARALASAVQGKAISTGLYDTTITDYSIDMGGTIPLNPCTGTTSSGYTVTATSTTATVSAVVGSNCGTWTPTNYNLTL